MLQMTNSAKNPLSVDSGAARIVPVRRSGATPNEVDQDEVAVEEPMEFCLEWPSEETGQAPVRRNIAVTMRTPGYDIDLALGFLFTEGILRAYDEVAEIKAGSGDENTVTVKLAAKPDIDLAQLDRNFYMTSSCGVCGKASIDAIRVKAGSVSGANDFQLAAAVLHDLPRQLKAQQELFHGTGSIHGAALFSANGLADIVREDVGRHNAVDKVVGASLLKGRLPLSHQGLLVSGRASFELVQKARMAGCPMLAAVGAPSSLAIDLAWDADMTLVGFLRDGRFNVYTSAARVI